MKQTITIELQQEPEKNRHCSRCNRPMVHRALSSWRTDQPRTVWPDERPIVPLVVCMNCGNVTAL